MAINDTTKSSRILQSRRYTQTQLADSQEAFTRVFDLNASEIYVQQDLIPSSSLPYSGSSQNGLTSGVIKFYYRQRLTPSDTLDNGSYSTFFFINPTSSIDFTNGINPGTLNANQQGNFISPKYAPTLPNETENVTPGYKVTLRDSGGTLINPTLYTFDYKTGVLQYIGDSGFSTIPSAEIYLTAYQYIGKTLESLSTNLTASYAITASYAMNGGGSGPSSPSSLIYSGSVTASVDVGQTSFRLISGSTTMMFVSKSGNIGIGTTTPTYKLDVNGSTKLNSDVYLPGLTNSTQTTVVGINISTGQLYYQAAVSGGAGGGGGTITTQYTGSIVNISSSILNFTGSGVTLTDAGAGITTIYIPGGGGGSALAILDEGGTLTSAATSIDFTGAGVAASAVGSAITVNVPGTVTNADVNQINNGALGDVYIRPQELETSKYTGLNVFNYLNFT